MLIRLQHEKNEPLHEKTNNLGSDSSDTNQAVQSQNKARSLKLWIQVEEELHYPCSKNKGADQPCSYCTADLRLCFRLCRLLIFPWGSSNALCISRSLQLWIHLSQRKSNNFL